MLRIWSGGGIALEDFPARLRRLRETTRPVRSMRITSQLMGLPPDALGKYERGESEAGHEALRKIANYYHVSTDYLLGITEHK